MQMADGGLQEGGRSTLAQLQGWAASGRGMGEYQANAHRDTHTATEGGRSVQAQLQGVAA